MLLAGPGWNQVHILQYMAGPPKKEADEGDSMMCCFIRYRFFLLDSVRID